MKPGVCVPEVYWEYEYVEGIKINNLSELKADGYDLATLARMSARICLKMVFNDGFFIMVGTLSNIDALYDLGISARTEKENFLRRKPEILFP